MKQNSTDGGSDVDRVVSELLDTERHSTEKVLDMFAPFSVTERQRAADLLLMDALLERVEREPAAKDSERVGRALAAIGRESNRLADVGSNRTDVISLPRRDARSHRSLAWWVPTALAAAVVIGAGLFVLRPSGNAAYAAVVKAYNAMGDRTIREYHLTIERNLPKIDTEAKLWVSGSDRFALTHPAVLPGNFWIGSDGRERWFVPAVGPVLVSDDPGLPRRWLLQQDTHLPFLQLSTMLDQLRQHYELSMDDDEHLHGTLRTVSLMLPKTVDVEIDPTTGVVRQLILSWPEDALRVGPRKITLTLASENAIGEEWFSHETHHDPRRSVVRAPRTHN